MAIAQLPRAFLGLLLGVTVNDAFTVGGAAVLLVAGVVPAAWIPTRPALNIEAWQILRDD